MAAESVGSCDGPPLRVAEHRSPVWEQKNSAPNTPDRPCYRKTVICYSCNQEGHYSPQCPSKAKRASPASSPHSNPFPKWPQKYADLPCKSCHRPCIVRTSNSLRNPGRDYYMCMNNACNMFVQWCDEVVNIQSRGVNSLVKPVMQPGAAELQNPVCLCTAGPCRVETKQSGPHKGRKYFACHLKLGQGACDHFQWCDGLGDDVEMRNGVNHNAMAMERNKSCGAFEGGMNGAILLEDMYVSPVSPSTQPPTTPRTEYEGMHMPSGPSPSKRPSLLEGSPPKRKRMGERMSDCAVSPSLDCYLDRGSLVPHSAPHPVRGHHSENSQFVCSAMRRLGLSEDYTKQRRGCAVCGDDAGHWTEECLALVGM